MASKAEAPSPTSSPSTLEPVVVSESGLLHVSSKDAKELALEEASFEAHNAILWMVGFIFLH